MKLFLTIAKSIKRINWADKIVYRWQEFKDSYSQRLRGPEGFIASCLFKRKRKEELIIFA